MPAPRKTRTKAEPKLMVATATFSADVSGREVIVHAGVTKLYDDATLVREHPELFEPVRP
jgi:hypothetical protein